MGALESPEIRCFFTSLPHRQKSPKWHPKAPKTSQNDSKKWPREVKKTTSSKKVKTHQNNSIYYVLTTYSRCAAVTFPPQNHLKTGSATQPPLWTPKITQNTENLPKMTPRGDPEGTQNRSKIHLWPQRAQDRGEIPKVGSPRPPKWSPRSPKWPPEDSKMTPNGCYNERNEPYR